jgi:dsDNA-specific endonuclease/ATPase MutS2
MNEPGPSVFPGWDTLCKKLAAYTGTPAGQLKALCLQPAFNRKEVELLQRQSQEAEKAGDLLIPTNNKALAQLLTSLEKPPLLLPLQQIQAYPELAQILRKFKAKLQAYPKQVPWLWQELQSLSWPEDLERVLSEKNSLDQKQRMMTQRWRQLQIMAKVLSQLDLLWAKNKLTKQWNAQWPELSQAQEIHLAEFRWPLALLQDKPAPKGDLHWPNQSSLWLLSGSHGSGKTALMQNLALAVLMHQSGFALPCSRQSCLPVFTGLKWVPENLPIREQLKELHEIIKRSHSHQLLLLDNPLAGSNPGESHALLRALIQELAGKSCKLLISTHNSLLSRLAEEHPGITKMALSKQGKIWQLQSEQWTSSNLIQLAQAAGWPAGLLEKAKHGYGQLKPLKTVNKPSSVNKKTNMPPPAGASLPKISPGVKIGAWVYVDTIKAYGELASLPDNRGEVSVLLDRKKWTVPARYVRLSSHRKEKKGDTSGIQIIVHSIASQFCDLHNLRVHEAMIILDKFLDTALHEGLNQVSIIHGKGEGILKAAVHEHLKTSRYVRNFKLAEYGQGDSGVTVVELA